jgi:hypothetical protein
MDDRRRARMKIAGLAVLVGIVIGGLTGWLQGLLPGAFNNLANSGAIWLIAAFVIGAIVGSVRSAAVLGLIVVASEVVGYYAYAQFLSSGIGDLRAPTVWLIVASVSGPLLGVAGSWWRTGSTRQRLCGIALLAGAFVGEGLHHLFQITDHQAQGIGFVVVGLALALALARSWSERALALLCSAGVGLVVLAGFALLDQVLAG